MPSPGAMPSTQPSGMAGSVLACGSSLACSSLSTSAATCWCASHFFMLPAYGIAADIPAETFGGSVEVELAGL